MKQFFALAISCLTVAAFAQPKMNANGAMPNHAKVGAPVMRFDVNAPMQPVQMSGRMDRAMTLEDAKPAQGNVVTSTATGALYRPSSHVLKYGLFYNEEVNKWGYSYHTPYLASQAYKGTYEKVEGSNWTIGTNNSEVPADYLDAEGNLDMGLAGMGVGGYYTPKIWSKTGSASYFYGSDDPDGGFVYSVNFKGDVSQASSLSTYQVYGDVSIYSGYSNTLAYGAREFTNNKGSLIQSDMLVIDYGDLGGGFVLQKIEMPILTHDKDVPSFTNDAVVTIKVIDYDEETQETKEYTSIVGKDDIYTDANGNELLYATFTEVDEDGFETAIDPVLNHYVQVVMTGFRQEGINWGLRMVWDNTADDETRSGGDFGPSHGYYDQWVDGVQDLDSDGNPALYATDCTEPVLELIGYFNALCEYGTGSKVMTGEAPVEGGYVVTTIEDGETYNDFDVETSFTYEKIEVTEKPEWVTKIESNDSYYEEYGIVAYYVTTEALPAGVAGRAGDVVLTSNGEVSMTLHVVQGDCSTPASKLSLNLNSATLLKGESLTLIANISPSNGINNVLNWSSNNTSVATVNSNGVITAKNTGTARISASTTDVSNLTAYCDVTVISSGYTDVSKLNYALYSTETTVVAGKQIDVKINLKNVNAITSWQADLKLPSGITVANDDNGNPYVWVSGSRSTSSKHNISIATLSNGLTRLLCTSTSNKIFSGADGEVATIKLNVSEGMDSGEFPIEFQNISLAETNSDSHWISNLTSKINVFSYSLGDVNNDGAINSIDLVGIVTFILETPIAGNIWDAADLNCDNIINNVDFVTEVNVILGVISLSNKRAEARPAESERLTIEPFDIAAGKQTTILIKLDAMGSYSSAQFDLALPKGIKVADCRSLSEKHALAYSLLPDDTYRFLMTSASNDCLIPQNGIISLTIEADKDLVAGAYQASVEDICLVEANTDYVCPDAENVSFFVGSTNGIDTINIDNRETTIYNIYGKKAEIKCNANSSMGSQMIDGQLIIVK